MNIGKFFDLLGKIGKFSAAAEKFKNMVQLAKENDGRISADEALVIVGELCNDLLPLVDKSAMKQPVKEADLPG